MNKGAKGKKDNSNRHLVWQYSIFGKKKWDQVARKRGEIRRGKKSCTRETIKKIFYLYG